MQTRIELDDNNPSSLPPLPVSPDTIRVEASTVKVGDELFYDGNIFEVREIADGFKGEIDILCDPSWKFSLRPTSEIQRVVRGGGADVVLDQTSSTPTWLQSFGVLPVAVVAASIADRVKKEDRRRLPTRLRDCWIDESGTLEHNIPENANSSNPWYGEELVSSHLVSASAWKQLEHRAPAATRAPANLSSWLRNSRASADLLTMRESGTDDRVVFAAVSDRYRSLDIDAVSNIVSSALPDSTVADYKYDGDGGRWRVTYSLTTDWMIDVPDSTGNTRSERHVPQIVVRGSDDGTNALRVQFRAVRWACTNGQVLGHSAVSRRVRHVGDRDKVLADFVEALRGVDDDVEKFSARWAKAYGTMWRGAVGEGRAEQIDGLEALRRLCAHGLLPTNGRRRHTVWSQYKEAFEEEPGDSLAHVVNAVTRFAHEGAVTASKAWSPSTWAQEDVEDQVEKIYSYVMRVLPAIDEDVSRFS